MFLSTTANAFSTPIRHSKHENRRRRTDVRVRLTQGLSLTLSLSLTLTTRYLTCSKSNQDTKSKTTLQRMQQTWNPISQTLIGRTTLSVRVCVCDSLSVSKLNVWQRCTPTHSLTLSHWRHTVWKNYTVTVYTTLYTKYCHSLTVNITQTYSVSVSV